MRDIGQNSIAADEPASRVDPPSSSASVHARQNNLERGLTMTQVPRPAAPGARTKNHVYGPRDSLEMSFAGDYVPPPPRKPGPGGLCRSTSELGASNDSARTERTAASSTTCASSSESLDRFGPARPRIPTGTADGTSERSLIIDCITCEEPAVDDEDDVNDDDDDDDDDRNKHKRPVESIMKYKTLEESLKNSYESSRRKHLKKRTQKKKKKRASLKRNRNSGTALARMGRRVGSLPNMKRAVSSVVRLGSTAKFDGVSSGKANEGSTSTHTAPKGGETNADWASQPVPAAATAAAASSIVLPKASTGNIFLDMLEKKEETNGAGIKGGGAAKSIPKKSCNGGAISAAKNPMTSFGTAPTGPTTSSTKESTGNIFLDMLKQQDEEERQLGADRAVTPPLLGLSQPPAVNHSSNLVSMSNVTAGAGPVFDPRLTAVRDIADANITTNETSNVSERPLHSTADPVENKPPFPDSSSISPARARRTGRRASYGDVSDLRKNVNFAVEELSQSKKSKKRLSFGSMSKAFNESLSSLLSNGSKSQGDGIDEEEDNENYSNSPVLRFSTLEIREYDTQLDTNPSVSCGPAMALSWSYTVSARVTIEKYEEHRPPRRKMKEMRVPASERERRLRMSGVSRNEIEASIKSIQEARKKRRKAIRQMKNDTIYEKMEGARQKLLKLLGRRKSQKQQEQELWENAQYYFDANTT